SRAVSEDISAIQTNGGVPRIILLPPIIVAEDEVVSRIAGALVEDVISGLSRCRSFAVIAPHTTLKLRNLEAASASPKLDIQYAVQTVVKPVSSGLQLLFRLTNCLTGTVLWSTELKFDLNQLPLLFGQFTHQVIHSLADAIEQSELRLPYIAESANA